MTNDQEIEFTVAVLRGVLEKGASRLATSMKRREETYNLIQEGKDNYRTEWLRGSVLRIIDTLGEIALEFDAAHPDEVCSVQDFGDILASTINSLKKM